MISLPLLSFAILVQILYTTFNKKFTHFHYTAFSESVRISEPATTQQAC